MTAQEGLDDPARTSGFRFVYVPIRFGSRSTFRFSEGSGTKNSSSSVTTPGGSLGAQIELQNVARQFAATGSVIDPLSFKIDSGEFVSLLGPSGCGKSTLLRLIAGLDRSDQGRLDIQPFGREFYRGFVFQDAHLLPWRSVLENTALPLELIGHTKTQREEAALEALAKVGLADSIHKFPNQLSGGMRMRVSVARALVGKPTLLLLDEPFAALDEQTRYQLQDDLLNLWRLTKMTVVFVTHSISEAAYLSTRAIVFSPRPAKVLLDRKIAIMEKRRTDPQLLKEIELLGEAFRRGVSK